MNTAIDKSIKEKWIPIANGEKTDGGIEDCECCIEYRKPVNVIGLCDDCPIFKHTGVHNCGDTPYKIWDCFTSLMKSKAIEKYSVEYFDMMIEAKLAALMEINFLQCIIAK